MCKSAIGAAAECYRLAAHSTSLPMNFGLRVKWHRLPADESIGHGQDARATLINHTGSMVIGIKFDRAFDILIVAAVSDRRIFRIP